MSQGKPWSSLFAIQQKTYYGGVFDDIKRYVVVLPMSIHNIPSAFRLHLLETSPDNQSTSFQFMLNTVKVNTVVAHAGMGC